MLCPNCMSPYIEPMPPEEDSDEQENDAIEPLFRCTECEYAAPKSEFIPEDYR